MNKLLKNVVIAVVFLSGLVFTGCIDNHAYVDNTENSYDTWFKYQKKIAAPVVSSSDADTDTAEESTVTLTDAEVYIYYGSDSGALVVIQSSSTQTSDMLKGLYSTNTSATMGAVMRFTMEQFNKQQWQQLWMSENIKSVSDKPTLITKSEECIILQGDNRPSIQWKRILSNYLKDKMLKN